MGGGRDLVQQLQLGRAHPHPLGHPVEARGQRAQLAHPVDRGLHGVVAVGDPGGGAVEVQHRPEDRPARHGREHRHAREQQQRHPDRRRWTTPGPGATACAGLLRRAGVDEGEHLPDRLHDLGLGVQVVGAVEQRGGAVVGGPGGGPVWSTSANACSSIPASASERACAVASRRSSSALKPACAASVEKATGGPNGVGRRPVSLTTSQ